MCKLNLTDRVEANDNNRFKLFSVLFLLCTRRTARVAMNSLLPAPSNVFESYAVAYCEYIHTRRPVPSTDQANPSCFYFRISWISMEQRCFYFFWPLGFLEGLRSFKHWLLQKLSMKNLDQKFKFLIKK